MRPGEGAAAPPPAEELADDFFELTESDLRGISLGGGAQGAGAAMQTKAMRELKALEAMKEYSHALIRVRLPGGILVQAAFHPQVLRTFHAIPSTPSLPHCQARPSTPSPPQEPIEHVLSLVLSCLVEGLGAADAYLFTTPPRTVLPLDRSLVESGLVPAATAILAWHSPLPEPLAALSGEALLRPFAKELLAASAAAAAAAAHAVAFPTDAKAKEDARAAQVNAIGKRLLGGAGGGGAAGGAAASAAASSAEGGEGAAASSAGDGASKPSKPKWLKM